LVDLLADVLLGWQVKELHVCRKSLVEFEAVEHTNFFLDFCIVAHCCVLLVFLGRLLK